MKLTDIDLNDKTEVAAAHALLAAVLGEAIPQMTVTNRVGEISQTATGRVQQLAQAGVIEQNPAAVFAQPGTLPAGAQPMQDAAAVFGATPLPIITGLPATSAQGPASGSPNNGDTSAAPGAVAMHISPDVHAQTYAQVAAAAQGPAAGVELDSKGLPWDARIHASTKSKKKDGSWTALRGLNDEAKTKQIEAELRTRVAASQGAQLGAIVQAQSATPLPSNTAAPQTTPPAQLPVTSGPASSAGNALPGATLQPGSIPATPLPGASGAASSMSAAPSDAPTTFEQLMPRVTQAVIAGTLPPTALQQVCGTLGLPSVVALQTNPAYVPHAWAQLKAAYPALQ